MTAVDLGPTNGPYLGKYEPLSKGRSQSVAGPKVTWQTEQPPANKPQQHRHQAMTQPNFGIPNGQPYPPKYEVRSNSGYQAVTKAPAIYGAPQPAVQKPMSRVGQIQANRSQELLNRQLLQYQKASGTFHEALRQRNLELNTKLSGLAFENDVILQQREEQQVRHIQSQDTLLQKYQRQTDQIVQLKRMNHDLVDSKMRLEQRLAQMTFSFEQQISQHGFDARQAVLRAESAEKTFRQVLQIKEDQLNELRGRVRALESERLQVLDEKRMQAAKNSLENMSQINHISQSHQKPSKGKENAESNQKDSHIVDQLKQQQRVNTQLKNQVQQLTVRLDEQQQSQIGLARRLEEAEARVKRTQNGLQQAENELKQSSVGLSLIQAEEMLTPLLTLRQSIVKELFDPFVSCVKQGEKHRKNSLLIFIEKWKQLDTRKLSPFLKSYFQNHESLVRLAEKNKQSPGYSGLVMGLPLHAGKKKDRNELNQWVLTTVELTQKQREAAKQGYNNNLLYLFRLLAIEYRIVYPTKGLIGVIDKQVENELHHQLCEGAGILLEQKKLVNNK